MSEAKLIWEDSVREYGNYRWLPQTVHLLGAVSPIDGKFRVQYPWRSHVSIGFQPSTSPSEWRDSINMKVAMRFRGDDLVDAGRNSPQNCDFAAGVPTHYLIPYYRDYLPPQRSTNIPGFVSLKPGPHPGNFLDGSCENNTCTTCKVWNMLGGDSPTVPLYTSQGALLPAFKGKIFFKSNEHHDEFEPIANFNVNNLPLKSQTLSFFFRQLTLGSLPGPINGRSSSGIRINFVKNTSRVLWKDPNLSIVRSASATSSNAINVDLFGFGTVKSVNPLERSAPVDILEFFVNGKRSSFEPTENFNIRRLFSGNLQRGRTYTASLQLRYLGNAWNEPSVSPIKTIKLSIF